MVVTATEIPRDLAVYSHRLQLATRWNDNDAFGHMNNAVHYQFFDTAVNRLLQGLGRAQAQDDPHRFLVVETGCRYFAEMAFPDLVTVGVRVGHIGRSSVRYELALFRNAESTAAATGFLVHVNTATGKAREIEPELRQRLAAFI